MKKTGKITMTITVGVMCFILVTVMFIQFKTISQTDINSIENMREDELRTEITSLKTKYQEVSLQLEETNNMIEEYETTINSDKEASELLEQELDRLENIVGENDVTGEGIIVTLKDTENIKIEANDLLVLLNELKSSGAEAISINDQRIIYSSYVADINGTYISVNGKRIVSPYVVKAIGNTTYLESGISQKQYGYIDTRLTDGKDIELETKKEITIKKYNGDLNFEYVKEEQA